MFDRIVPVSAVCGLLILAGCASTDDPRHGGLFSYSPEKYEQRLADREARLAAIEEEQSWELDRQAALKKARDSRTKEIRQLKSDQARMDKKIRDLKRSGKSSEAAELARKNEALKKELAEIESRSRTADTSPAEIAAKREKIRQLKQEREALEAEAEVLSGL